MVSIYIGRKPRSMFLLLYRPRRKLSTRRMPCLVQAIKRPQQSSLLPSVSFGEGALLSEEQEQQEQQEEQPAVSSGRVALCFDVEF